MLAALLAMGLGAGGKGAREVLFCQDMVRARARFRSASSPTAP